MNSIDLPSPQTLPRQITPLQSLELDAKLNLSHHCGECYPSRVQVQGPTLFIEEVEGDLFTACGMCKHTVDLRYF